MFHLPEFSNMNLPAPVSVLGFLAAIAGLVLCVLTTVVLLFVGKARWATRVGVLVAAGAVVYFGLLFVFALASREATLVPGQEKYFCEIDCHLAYSVAASRGEVAGVRRELHVAVRTRFDENTISPQRPKDAPLTPNPRQAVLIDGRGRRFDPSVTSGPPLTRSLVPGEAYETELTFLVAIDSTEFRLLITSPGWEEHLLIGDENSPGHKKTYLAVPAAEVLSRNE